MFINATGTLQSTEALFNLFYTISFMNFGYSFNHKVTKLLPETACQLAVRQTSWQS
jgi:hypothetical protein